MMEASPEEKTSIIEEEDQRPTGTYQAERAFTRDVAKMVKGVLKAASSMRSEADDASVGTVQSGLMGILEVSSLSGTEKQAVITAMQKTLMEQMCKVGNQGGISGAATPMGSEASGGPGDEESRGQGSL